MIVVKCDICGCDEGVTTLLGYEVDMCGTLMMHPQSRCDLCMRCQASIKEAIRDTISDLLRHQPRLYLEDRSKKKKPKGGCNG